MNPSYQNTLVLGLGASGAAAARLLRAEGTSVTVLDRKLDAVSPAVRAELESSGVQLLESQGDLPAGPFEVAVVSPGVPLSSPWIHAARARGLPLLSELELGWSRRSPSTRVWAVTGSNGKSNAVKWMAEALAGCGYKVGIAGNYGPPVCRVVREQAGLDWLVLEVSSFQLETVRDFRAEVGVLLNLVPNHLDRHGDFDTYLRAKAGMFSRVVETDLCLVHEGCAEAVRRAVGGSGRWRVFGESNEVDYRYADGRVWCGARELADISGTYFGNEVLGLNAAGMLGAWSGAGLEMEGAIAAARAFRPLPNRMETVIETRGVRFVNDSKSTTLTALAAGVRMCPGGVRLIAGGLLKENDLGVVKEVLAQRVLGVYLIGKASESMAAAWSDVTPCHACGTLEGAVEKASREARSGETVLLSPGCASFDQFRNFEERGEAFRKSARYWAGKKAM